ncbi:hypothetical protein LJC42_05655 [Eubacteriales bacterium OttesenSCG-928-K08]|nr:hypothetical protein [Eubacteriales bacterium OttesenSCG-928-K08]
MRYHVISLRDIRGNNICEANHDAKGPIWPLSIAPWQVQICCIHADDAKVKSAGDQLYNSLIKAGIETLYDDREVSAGIKFSDADLFGIPIRVIISPRNLAENSIEVMARNKEWSEKVSLDYILQCIIKRVSGQY